ncbi:MAG: hypothetical protein R3C46_08460 [Hyphomonadaceae bacterium]
MRSFRMETPPADKSPEAVEAETSRKIVAAAPIRALMVAGGGILLGCILVLVVLLT